MSGGGPQPPFTRQFSASSSAPRVVDSGQPQPTAVAQQQQQQPTQQEQQHARSSPQLGHYYPPPPPQGFTGSSEMGVGYPAAPGGVYAMPAGGHFMMAAYPMGAYGPGNGMVSPIMGNVLSTSTGQQQGGLGFNPRGMQQQRPHNRRGGIPGSTKQLVHFDEALAATEDVDRAIVSALKQPQHRRLLLEVEPAIQRMITETDSERLKLTNPLGKYQRMLIHKLGDYFRMDREVDYTKGSEMSTVTLIRTERTCVPNTILQELCRSALEAAEMNDNGRPWPYMPKPQHRQQPQHHHQEQQQQQERFDTDVPPPHDHRSHSDEGACEGGVASSEEHCADMRGTCSEGDASGGGTPSETMAGEGGPAGAAGAMKRRSVKILRRGPGSKNKNGGMSRPDESSSDEGGKHSEANLLHNLPVDQREEHYNKIRAKIFEKEDSTPVVCSNEDLAGIDGVARKHIPKGTDLDDPDYNRQAVSIIPQLGRVQQAPPTLHTDPVAYNAAFPVLGGAGAGGPLLDDESRNKDRRRGGKRQQQQQQQQFRQQKQQYGSNAGNSTGAAPMSPYSHGGMPSAASASMMQLPHAGTAAADAATIAAFQQGYIAATMAAAAAAQQQGVVWTPPPPPSMAFPSQQQQDSLLPNPSGGTPPKFSGYYQPAGMPQGSAGEGASGGQQWGGAGATVPSPRKGGRGTRHGGLQGAKGGRGGGAALNQHQQHHQQGSSRKANDVGGLLNPRAGGWGSPEQQQQQLQSPQGAPTLQQQQYDFLHQQQQQQHEQLAQALESQSGLDTTAVPAQRGSEDAPDLVQGQRSDYERSNWNIDSSGSITMGGKAPQQQQQQQPGMADQHHYQQQQQQSASVAEGSTTTPTAEGSSTF